MPIKAFPESNESICTDCHNPSMDGALDLCPNTDIRIQSKAQEQTTQQSGMIFTILAALKKSMLLNIYRYLKQRIYMTD